MLNVCLDSGHIECFYASTNFCEFCILLTRPTNHLKKKEKKEMESHDPMVQINFFFWGCCRVFWVNIAKSEVNLRYRNYSNLFGILRRDIEFRYYYCWNSTKSMREKKKKVERENVEFRQWGYRISCAQFCCLGVCGVPEVKRKKNWQTNCGNAIAEIGE